MRQDNDRRTFVVPAGAGTYAPEVLDLTRGPQGPPSDSRSSGGLFELSVLVESLPATAAIELDLLKAGGNVATPGDWILAVKSWDVAGLADMVPLAAWYGARLRAKSGGTGGNAIVSASWT